MPLYSDSNFYYTSGGGSGGSPYYTSGLYGVSSSSSSNTYTPYTATYSRAMTGSYVVPISAPRSPTISGLTSRYQPKLSTITESPLIGSSRHTTLMPLTRIQSPKYSTYTAPIITTSPKYIPARPININTADIDVSSSRYHAHHRHQPEEDQKKETVSTPSPNSSTKATRRESNEINNNSVQEETNTRQARSTIKRNRAVVRLSTVRSRSKDRNKAAEATTEPIENRFRDLPRAPVENLTWRQKLAQDLADIPTYPLKKTPGELLRERYLIQEAKNDEVSTPGARHVPRLDTATNITEASTTIDKVVVELDPVDHTIRRLSIPNCPTFHDICEDISSDKIDDDLNAGVLRRRASLIQEQEQELFSQLQDSVSETFQMLPLERHSSHESLTDDSGGKPKHSSKKTKKRHKITAIVEIENAPLITVEEETITPKTIEEQPKPKFTFNVESVEEHHEIHKIFKLPKKKSTRKSLKAKKHVSATLPDGFVPAIPKAQRSPKTKEKEDKPKTFISTAEIFTFSQQSVEECKADELEKQPDIQTTDEPDIAVAINTPKQEKAKEEVKPKLVKQEAILSEPSPSAASKPIKTIESKVPEKAKASTAEKVTTITKPKEPEKTLKSSISVDLTPVKDVSKVLNKSKSLTIEEAKSATIPAIKPPLIKTKAIQESKEEKSSTQSPKTKISTTSANTKQSALKSAISLDTPASTTLKPSVKVLEKTQSLNIEEPKVAAPKPIEKKIQKSESGEDFWSQIGTRESIYMANRKNNILGSQWSKQEDLSELPGENDDADLIELKATTDETLQKQKIEQIDKKENDKPESKPMVSPKTEIPTIKVKSPTKAVKPSMELGKSKPAETSAAVMKKATTTKTVEQSKTLTMPDTKASIPAPKVIAETAPTETTTTMTATTTKIISGQEAKSPEQQQATISTIAAASQRNKPNNEKTISSSVPTEPVAEAKKTELATTAVATKSPTATTLAKTTAEKTETVKTKQPPTATSGTKQTETKAPKLSEAAKKSSADPKPTGITNANNTNTLATDKCKKPAATANKTKASAAGKPTTTPTEAVKSSQPTATTKTSPTINADQFVTVAPPKVSATSPIKKMNASPTATKPTTVAAKQQPPSPQPVNDSLLNIKATAAATTTTTASAGTTTTKAATSTTTTPASATTTSSTKITATTTTTNTGANDNGLAKFPTVSNLSQCLQDVDGDLDDYIPSSAENSDDDSSYDYSSPDGCENLSASMKKKLKQRRKKEKQAAEPARFDPQKKVKIDPTNKCYTKEQAPRYPLVATPRPLWKREKINYANDSDDSDSDESGSTEETTEDSDEYTSSSEYEDDLRPTGDTNTVGTPSGNKENSAIIRLSTCSNDSGFEGGTAPSSPKKMLECDVNCHKKCERLTANLCGVNQKLIVEALAIVKRGARETRDSPSTPPSSNPAYKIEPNEEHDETSYTYSQFQKSGRFTAPATVIPRFKNYTVDDFHFLTVLGKGSFGKVLLAELRDTTYYYAVKCLKKDVVLEDDDVDSTLIERKVLALGTKHPYLCHLFCTFQTESHLFFVMEYLNGGDLMFHIQESGRFTEERARFYGAEIISGLKFLHKKGIIYRDLKLDNVLLDYEGHVRIADFGMCKLQIYLDKTADSFCGTPDYMAPEIIKGEKYNQNVDWWSFGVLLYEMLIGQSPFSGCDEDELFWSICNEVPWFPVYISAEATSILKGLLEKDYTKRVGSQYSTGGDIAEHIFFMPIDWKLLDKRQLEPPFKPQVKHPLDTQYFDRVFTRERVRLTPIDKEILQSMDQKQFHGFTYTNPHITLD